MKQPFARFLSIMTVLRNLIAKGVSVVDAQVQSGATSYRSRGKGGKHSKPGKSYRTSQVAFIGKKQQAKFAARQVMRVVNGFELMQTLPNR